ncbi:MAG TPA: hypothetical protein VNE39_02345 [Planctomycetota bacterium]|nr:hypothetical protein [Planctomycetota bacterium]
MRTNERSRGRAASRVVLACLLAAFWAGRAAAGEDVGAAAKPAKKPLIWINVPNWTHDDANWGGPYDGPTTRRMCQKILKDEAAKIGVELCTDASKMKECDGGLSCAAPSAKADMPFVDVVFQGHRGFYDQFRKGWDLTRKRYLLASTNDPEWLRTGLRLLKAASQMRSARVCVVTDEAGAADTAHPQLGTTFHPVPSKRLDDEVRKASDKEATAVAVDYMHQGRMDGTVEGHSGYERMPGQEKWLPPMEPARYQKVKQEMIAAAKFHLGCRNLLAAENCQALTLTGQAKYGAAPVLAFSGLADSGIAAAFDRDATLMLMMTGFLFDRAGFAHGPLAKQGENAFVATYFTCPTRLLGYDYEPPASFAIGPGQDGKDFGIQVRWRKGEPITRLQIKDSKLLMATGRVRYSDITVKKGHRTAVVIELEDRPGRPDPDAANCVIVYGDCTNEISCLARLMDLDFPPAPGVLVPK